MRMLAVVIVLVATGAGAQVPAGVGGTAADADKGDFAPPSTGCGNVDCEIAAACASANPGFAAQMCADTVRASNAIRLAALKPAPLPPDAPLVINPDGSMPKGRAVMIAAGVPTPFAGVLVDAQEHTRRERINERNAAELLDLKDPSNVTLPRYQLVLIGSGVAVAAAVVATAITVGAMKANEPHR